MSKYTIPDSPKDWQVMLVDDRPDNLEIATLALNFYGVKVHGFANSLKAFAQVETLKPHLILLDLSMPQMSGWEFFEKVRHNPATANIPIIAMTAMAMFGDKEKVLETGFDGYISKPFDVTALITYIQKTLSA